ncbi:MAG: CRISPR-associated endonuclease Cas1 [Promethearchaeota archaeon]
MAVIYLLEQGSTLRKVSRRLVVEKDGHVLLEVPEFKIERIIIFGNIQLTTQVMKFLLQSGIETSFMTIYGKLIGKLSPIESKNIELRMLQYKKFQDENFRLSLAKNIVKGKIKNSKIILQKYHRNHPEINFENQVKKMDALLRELKRKIKVPSVFGVEGRASAIYYSCFGRMFRKELRFEKRTKHPPLDPTNALLSLGYSLITNEMISVISSIGFDPYIGYFHGTEYGRPSLALDLIEEFRAPIIDRLTLEIFNKAILSSKDFEKRGNGIFLKDIARKKYYLQYERRMQQKFKNPQNLRPKNYREIFFTQAQKFANTLKDNTVYKPFTIR